MRENRYSRPREQGSGEKTNTFATSMTPTEGLLANCLILLFLVYVAVLNRVDPGFYIYSIQEDESLEWATFWAFLLAFLTAMMAARQYRQTGRLPWFLAGVGLFCFVVAMEEISWGQRILDYRPPVYFLEHNFQQEPNVHNLPSQALRQMTLRAVILGYGVLLPLGGLIPPLQRFFSRIGIIPPSLWLSPSFLITYHTYDAYPWDYSGEIVELLLGMGFLLALLPAARTQRSRRNLSGQLLPPLATWGMVVVLGSCSPSLTRLLQSANPELVATARVEIESLSQDFATMSQVGRARPTRCGTNKRVYTWLVQFNQNYLHKGAFSRLRSQGLPDARADFFLDPWNSPYWIRHDCSRSSGGEVVMVYSFGPNRRRESTEWEVRGDDVAASIDYRTSTLTTVPEGR